jgi:O-antigen ligase
VKVTQLFKKFSRNDLAYLTISLLLAGFLFNRVVHSVGIFFACIFIVTTKDWHKVLLTDRYILSFIIVAFSFLIFDMLHAPELLLRSTFFMKLALVVYPLFIRLWSPSRHDIVQIFIALALIMLINIVYGIGNYFIFKKELLEAYKQAKVLPTLALGDHIRMSWLTVLSIWGCIYTLRITSNYHFKWLILVYSIIAIAYLHLLSVKTGLLLLYSSFLIFGFYFFIKNDFKKAVLIVLFIIISPILAYKVMPSLQNRVAYIRWDIKEYLAGNRQKGLSDGSRIASLKAGIDLFRDNFLMGIGHANLKHATWNWYKKNDPQLVEEDYIMPSSQFLIVGASCGLIGLLIFVGHLLIPLFITKFKFDIFTSIYLPSIATFLYETHLEGQYAVFVYGFFMYLFFYISNTDDVEKVEFSS